jgi:hypothetical protein
MRVSKLSALFRLYLPYQEIFLVLIPVTVWVYRRAIGFCPWKIPTASGIEPGTFRLAALCLNQMRHRVYLMVGHETIRSRTNIKIYEAVQNKHTVFSYVTKHNVVEMNLRSAGTSWLRVWDVSTLLQSARQQVPPKCRQKYLRNYTTKNEDGILYRHYRGTSKFTA